MGSIVDPTQSFDGESLRFAMEPWRVLNPLFAFFGFFD